jgi:uncharacterized protein (TIGR03437 family)
MLSMRFAGDIMDAAFAAFKKTAFLLSLALLAAAPRLAQATPPAFTNPTNNSSITLSNGSGSVSVTGSGDATNNFIDFTVSVAYESGDRAWLKVGSDNTAGPGGLCNGGSNTYDTPIILSMGLDCNAGALSLGNHTAAVTLTATAPTGVTSVTFSVTYNTGGSGSGALVPTPSNLTGVNAMAAAAGAQVSDNVMLQTTSTSAIGFTATTGASWLTVQTSANQVSSSASATLIFTASAAGLSAGAYDTTATISYGSNQQLIINVTFNVGTSAVNLTPSALGWTYSSGALSPPGFQTANLTTPNSDSYTAQVSYVSGGASNWLLVNGSASVTGLFNGATLSISLANYTSLSVGTYTGKVTVADTENSNNFATLNVTLTVSGSTSGSLTITPSPISLSSTNSYEQLVTVTSAAGGTLTATPSSANNWLGVTTSASSIVPGASAFLTVSANTSLSGSGTFTGSISVTVGTVTQVVTVNLTSGSGAGGSSSGHVAPTTLNFVAQSGGSGVSQEIVFAGNGSFSISSSPNYSANGNSVAWFATQTIDGNMSAQGTAVTLYANPRNLAAGTYTATVPIGLVVNGEAIQNVAPLSVNFVVSSGAVLAANPGTLFLTGGAMNATVSVTATGSTPLPVSVSTDQTWLSATIEGGVTNTPATISVTVDSGILTNGLYAGNVTVTSSGTPPLDVPVIVSITGATNPSGLTLSSPSLTFAAQAGGNVPANQTLTVSSSPAGTPFSATASVTSPAGGTWLTISPKGSLTTTQALTVSVNQSGLANGSYAGTIALTANGSTVNVPVNLVVNATGTSGGNVTVSASSLAFSAVSGAAAPATQTLTVSSAAGSAGVAFTAAAASTGNWLSVSPTSGTTQDTLTVSVNQANLSTGNHTGTITITPTGGSAVVVQVTLTVASQPTILVTPGSLSFDFEPASGGTVTPGQLKVSATGGTASFSVTYSSTGNWLTVTPTSGSTSTADILTVQVNPAGLAASATPYTGTIIVTGVNGTAGSATVDVSLSISAPLPNITAVLNAASYVGAPFAPISPGEFVSIFGTSIGPANPAFLTLDSTGKVSTSIGGVTVSFSGHLAPLTYVSSTQINAVVPYEIAGNKAPFVEVTFAGQKSNEPSLPLTTTAPGIFTQNSSGTGPGLILSQNNQLNTQQNPAAVGSSIQIYVTGEGLTTPAQATGAVTPVNTSGSGPLTPAPQLAVSVMIGNLPAKVDFAGEAPFFVAGVLQVNAEIPAGATSGQNPITVQIGKNISQNGVTVWVQ